MKLSFISIVTTIALMALSGAVVARQSGPPTAAAKGRVGAGKTLYAKKCKNCHGAAGEGNPAVAKTMKVAIKDLGTAEIQQKTDEELRKSSVEGIGKMEPVKGLSATDGADLVAYVRSLKK
jgi:mono/diheme cytochrome c family protein